jgi:hypothetical protein
MINTQGKLGTLRRTNQKILYENIILTEKEHAPAWVATKDLSIDTKKHIPQNLVRLSF